MQTCSVCRHPKLAEINAALIRPETLREIATRYGTTKSALDRHRKKCLRAAVQAARAETEIEAGKGILAELLEITKITRGIVGRAIAQNDLRLGLIALGRLEQQLELRARLTGELDGAREDSGPRQVTITYVDKQLIAGQPMPPVLPALPPPDSD